MKPRPTTASIAAASADQFGHAEYFTHLADQGVTPQMVYLARGALADWWTMQNAPKSIPVQCQAQPSVPGEIPVQCQAQPSAPGEIPVKCQAQPPAPGPHTSPARPIQSAAVSHISRLADWYAARGEASDDPGRRSLIQKWSAIRRIAHFYGKHKLVAKMDAIDIRRRVRLAIGLDGHSRAYKALTPDQAAAFRADVMAINKPSWLRPMALLYMATGARLQEICTLRASSLIRDTSGSIVAINLLGKGSKWRSVPLCDPDARAVLDAHISSERANNHSPQPATPHKHADFLFHADRFNAAPHICHQSVAGEIARILERIGAKHKGLACHALRHTAATLLVEDGAPLDVVQRILGHSSMQTTARFYDHRRDESVFAEFAKHAQALAGTPIQQSLAIAAA